jgi:hypothetical protein
VSLVHLLEKRAIESYLPHTVLRRFDSSALFKEKVDSLFRMTAEQRRHYHMKAGFRLKDNPSPTKAEYQASPDVQAGEKALFASVPCADWNQLSGGFGKRLSSIFTEVEFRPNADDNRSVDPDARAEIATILDEIYERI